MNSFIIGTISAEIEAKDKSKIKQTVVKNKEDRMKEQKRNFALFLFIAAFAFSCSTTRPQLEPIMSQKIWEKKTKNEVFAKCLKAVQRSGYRVKSESEERGAIQADWRIFKKENKMHRFMLDIQILKSTEDTIIVTIKTKYQVAETVKSPTPDELWQAAPTIGTVWSDVPKDSDLEEYLDRFLLELQDLLGPAKTEIENI